MSVEGRNPAEREDMQPFILPSHSANLKRCGFRFSRALLFTVVHTTDVLGIGGMTELTVRVLPD